jgi:hypothetical protein
MLRGVSGGPVADREGLGDPIGLRDFRGLSALLGLVQVEMVWSISGEPVAMRRVDSS